MANTKPTIDPELEAYIPPLSPAEFHLLESSLLTDPGEVKLTGWQERGLLVDGHNRFRICEANGIAYAVEWKSFPDVEAVKLWMDEFQLGRRNLTDDQRASVAYRVQLRRSTLAKSERGKAARAAVTTKNPVASDLSDTASDKSEATAKRDTRAEVAKESRVSERKVRAVAEIAKASPSLVDDIAAGRTTINRARQTIRAFTPARAKSRKLAMVEAPVTPPPTVDELGYQIPPQVRPAAATGERIKRHIAKTSSLKAEHRAMAREVGGELIDQEADERLDEYRRVMKFAAFYTTCKCGGRGCRDCGGIAGKPGRGWITMQQYQLLTDEIKAKLAGLAATRQKGEK